MLLPRDQYEVRAALDNLMGIDGNEYAEEIINTGRLSMESFKRIKEKTIFNSRTSVIENFGIIQYYYNQSVITRVNKIILT